MADVVRKKGTSALVTLLGCLLFSCGNYQSETRVRIAGKYAFVIKKERSKREKTRIELNIKDIALSGVDVSEYESPQEI